MSSADSATLSMGVGAIAYSLSSQNKSNQIAEQVRATVRNDAITKLAAGVNSLDDLVDYLETARSLNDYQKKWTYISQETLARFASDFAVNADLLIRVNRDLIRHYNCAYMPCKSWQEEKKYNSDNHDLLQALNEELFGKIIAVIKFDVFADFKRYMEFVELASDRYPIKNVLFNSNHRNGSLFVDTWDEGLSVVNILMANRTLVALLEREADILRQINDAPVYHNSKSSMFKGCVGKIKDQTKTFESFALLMRYLDQNQRSALIESLKSPKKQDLLNMLRASLTSVTQLQVMMDVLKEDSLLQRQFLIVLGSHKVLDTLASKRYDSTIKDSLCPNTLLFLDRYAAMSAEEKQNPLGNMRTLTMRQ